MPSAFRYTTYVAYERSVERLVQQHSDAFEISTIGCTKLGRPIRCVRAGKGRFAVLVYGFPHPDENVGAGTILALLSELCRPANALSELDAHWLIVPGADIDLAMVNDLASDEAEPGRAAYPFKPCSGEIDFCFRNPRPEVQALWRLIDEARPRVAVSLHDAAHWTGYEPSYVITNPPPEKNLSTVVQNILFPEGVPVGHECVVGLQIPPGIEDNALATAHERLCPNSTTLMVEINAVNAATLAAHRDTDLDVAYYDSWLRELRMTLGTAPTFSDHPYEELLSLRYGLLPQGLEEQATKLASFGHVVPAPALLNLHASLLTYSYLSRLASKLDRHIPVLRTPPEKRGVVPKQFRGAPLLLDYETLVTRQSEVVVMLVARRLRMCSETPD